MEEWIGLQWHKLATRLADRAPGADAIRLHDVQRAATLLLHAGGSHHRIAPAQPLRVGGDRTFWQRVAGSGTRVALAQIDASVLALPDTVDVFDDAALNRDLVFWWAACAGALDPTLAWPEANRRATAVTLARFPGLRARFERLHDAARADALAADARVDEHAPLWTWIVPCGSAADADGAPDVAAGDRAAGAATTHAAQRRRARRHAAAPSRTPLLLAAKTEWLRTFADPLAIDRAEDDDADGSDRVAAQDLDELALRRSEGSVAARVRFDLDLPSASADDLPAGPGEHLPEWDAKRGLLRPGRVLVQPLAARAPAPWQPPSALMAQAARVRRQLSVQRAAPRWQRGASDGQAIDIDAWVRAQGEAPTHRAQALYQRRVRGQRELATLLMADLSLSTDAHANDTQRVIDVLREALFVFGQALAGSGDAFSICGFSSVRRTLRLHELKAFDEPWAASALARLGAIKPGYYTRMGAAVRAATRRLSARAERQRVLLLLTDGKPHDLDGYEGRTGVEDTREAVREARRAGLLPFALTIDDQRPDETMDAIFGSARGWAWVRRPQDVSARLTALYAQLTR